MVLVVTLTVRKAETAAFHEFERQAARIMARHGGVIERVVVIDSRDDEDTFKEVHIVTFPNADSFEAYRADDALRPIAHLRAQAVVSTVIWVGRAGLNYTQ